MIEIYPPYLYLIMFACIVVGACGGYLLSGIFVKGKTADENKYEVLLKEEEHKRKRLEKELKLEIEHGKQLEEANETILCEREKSFKDTFTEMHKSHVKVLLDKGSNKAKIPEKKIFKRRKMVAK